MSQTLKNFTDFYDHPEDHESAISQKQMVVTTQLMGLLLLGGAVLSLKTPTWTWKLEVAVPAVSLGVIFLIVWLAYCWGDLFLPRFRQLKNEGYTIEAKPYCTRNTKLLRATHVLVLGDTALITSLIVVTGGIGSPLDPLLGAISMIAIATRQRYSTVKWALATFLLVVAVLTILHVIHFQLGSWAYDAHSDPRFHLILGVMVISVTVLSIFQWWLSNETPPLLACIPKTVNDLLTRAQMDSLVDELTREIKKGARDWIRWLSDRRMPLKDLSLVHRERDVIEQAVILSLPYWIDDLTPEPPRFVFLEWITSAGLFVLLWSLGLHKTVRPCSDIVHDRGVQIRCWFSPFRRWAELRRRRKIVRNVTFLTIAAHWIDDHFDALEDHCPDQLTRERILRESPEQLMNPTVLGRFLPRLYEVISGMKKRAHKQNRHQIEHAVIRIIYGGLVQHASSRERFEQLRADYVQFINKDLVGEQKQAYERIAAAKRPLAIFLTAKVVMELLDSCRRIDDPATFIREAEFLNLLYCPILYYHDWNAEVLYEQYGKAFGDSDEIQKSLPSVPDLVGIVRACEALMPKVLGRNELSTGRRAQLNLLLELYGQCLPIPLTNAYRRFLHLESTKPSIAKLQPAERQQMPPSETHAA